MRILHIVNDADTGGAQTLIEQLLRVTRSGDEAHLLVLLFPASLSSRLEAVATSITYSRMSRKSVVPAKGVCDVLRLVKKHKIDVVHSHLHQSDLINELTPHGRPRVSTLHSSLDVSSNPVAKIVWRTVAGLSGRFNAIVACSASAKNFAAKLGYKFPAEQMRIVHNGSATAPSPAPEPSGEPVFVHLARFAEPKDHPNLFRAFAMVREHVPGATLVCAGHGVDDSNQELTRELEHLGIRDAVSLLGPVDNVRELIRTAHAVVFSSYHEALPMAGIEAIGEGVPVITTDTGDAKDLTVDGRAVVPVRNSQALAEAMTWYVQQTSEDRERMRQASWDKAATEFDAQVTADTYRQLYVQLLGAAKA